MILVFGKVWIGESWHHLLLSYGLRKASYLVEISAVLEEGLIFGFLKVNMNAMYSTFLIKIISDGKAADITNLLNYG